MIYLILFCIGVFSSYFGNFISGGIGSLSIGLMTLFGISPQMAGATFKIGKSGNAIAGILVHAKNKTIPKDLVLGSGIGLMCGAFIGSYLIFSVPERVIFGVSGTTMLILSIIGYYKKIGIDTRKEISNIRRYVGYTCYFLLSIVGNIFLAGSGVWYYFVDTFIYRISVIERKGLSFATNPFWFIGSFSGLLLSGQFDLGYGIIFGVGTFIGGYLSSQHMIKMGNVIIQKILSVSIVFLAIWFIYRSIAAV